VSDGAPDRPERGSGVKGAFDASKGDKPIALAPPVEQGDATELSIVALLVGLLLLGHALRRELTSSGPRSG
jgi:hypothetical protein